MEEVGQKIRDLRTETDYTLRELSEELDISFSSLAMYERGERTPPLDKLVLIADFFSVSTDYLLGRDVQQNKNTHILNGCAPIDISSNEYFYLSMQDDSMIEKRIYPGDLLLVQKKKKIGEEKVAAVKFEDSILIREIYYDNNLIILKPACKRYELMELEKEVIQILGEVIKVEYYF